MGFLKKHKEQIKFTVEAEILPENAELTAKLIQTIVSKTNFSELEKLARAVEKLAANPIKKAIALKELNNL